MHRVSPYPIGCAASPSVPCETVVADGWTVFLLFFADSAERAATQSLLMGSVALVVTLLLCLLAFFDHPHGHQVGKLRPTAMERTLVLLMEEAEAAGVEIDPPCDDSGTVP